MVRSRMLPGITLACFVSEFNMAHSRTLASWLTAWGHPVALSQTYTTRIDIYTSGVWVWDSRARRAWQLSLAGVPASRKGWLDCYSLDNCQIRNWFTCSGSGVASVQLEFLQHCVINKTYFRVFPGSRCFPDLHGNWSKIKWFLLYITKLLADLLYYQIRFVGPLL